MWLLFVVVESGTKRIQFKSFDIFLVVVCRNNHCLFYFLICFASKLNVKIQELFLLFFVYFIYLLYIWILFVHLIDLICLFVLFSFFMFLLVIVDLNMFLLFFVVTVIRLHNFYTVFYFIF